MQTLDPTAQTELQVQQAVLAGMTTQLDEIERCLPPATCVWQGTASAAYNGELNRLRQGVAILREHISAARSAVNRALAS